MPRASASTSVRWQAAREITRSISAPLANETVLWASLHVAIPHTFEHATRFATMAGRNGLRARALLNTTSTTLRTLAPSTPQREHAVNGPRRRRWRRLHRWAALQVAGARLIQLVEAARLERQTHSLLVLPVCKAPVTTGRGKGRVVSLRDETANASSRSMSTRALSPL